MKISHKELLKRYIYNPETGDFYYRFQTIAGRKVNLDKPVPYGKLDGYLNLYINGKMYRSHRLAWFYIHGKWPKFEIDHVDRNRANNSIKNLRDVPNKDHKVPRSPVYGYGEYMPGRDPNA